MYDKKVDIWAVGVLSFILLTGTPPFFKPQHAVKDELVFKKADGWDNISQNAKEFIQMCLTKNPEERPSVKEIISHEWIK